MSLFARLWGFFFLIKSLLWFIFFTARVTRVLTETKATLTVSLSTCVSGVSNEVGAGRPISQLQYVLMPSTDTRFQNNKMKTKKAGHSDYTTSDPDEIDKMHLKQFSRFVKTGPLFPSFEVSQNWWTRKLMEVWRSSGNDDPNILESAVEQLSLHMAPLQMSKPSGTCSRSSLLNHTALFWWTLIGPLCACYWIPRASWLTINLKRDKIPTKSLFLVPCNIRISLFFCK